jgi:4-hydroxybenzoate polyprenyltransferase
MSTAAATGIPWTALARLIRLQNQTGTYLLVLPTLWTLILAAGGWPAPRLVAIFVAGSFLMRSAGVILNDLADRSFDRQVARTKTRPLASGELSRRQALALLGFLLLAASGLLLLLDPFVWPLAPIALVLAALYPFSKRWIHVPQAVLGVAFGWGTIMAWAAVQGRLAGPVWLLFGATATWAIAYDTIYALQDREDDRRIGVKSAALFFGTSTWMAVATALSAMLILLGAAGWMTGIGLSYYTVLLGVALFFAVQVRQLRRPVSPSEAFAMFRAHMWAGAAILVGVLAGFVL